MVWNYADIAAAEAEGKIAILMHAHTPSIIGNDLRRLEILQMLGLRIIGFSHQQRSLLAEGAGEDLHDGDGGLSRFGVAVLKEMNRLQMVADLGHASDQSILQAARISEQPIIVSHTCVRALSDHRSPSLLQRNISDDAIRAVADNQGVVGIMALTPHLLAEQSDRKPSIELYLDHIEHVIDLAGIDHVGIGTETGHGTTADTMRQVMAEVTGRLGDNTPAIDTFRAVANLPPGTALVVPGMEDMSRAKYNLIGEMIRRGYSDEAIEKILGRNFLRVYQAVLPA
jgi:membrane dipeptidase